MATSYGWMSRRNSSEYEVKLAAARLFRKASVQHMVPMFTSLLALEHTYESTFDSGYMAPGYPEPSAEQKLAGKVLGS